MNRKREVAYLECDGCGYALPNNRYAELTLPYKVSDSSQGKLTFHFHEASSQHDCLRYWLTGMGIMERSLKAREPILPADGRAVVLKAVGAFRQAVA